MPTLAGNKHPSIHFSLKGYVLSIIRRKKYEPNPSQMDIEVLIPRRHNEQ